MTTLTIELTDISTEMLADLAARAKQRQANSMEEYVRTLIKQDVRANKPIPLPNVAASSNRFQHLLDCIRQQVAAEGYTEQELSALFEQARAEARQVRNANVEAPDVIKDHPWAKVTSSMGGETWREMMEDMKREREEDLLTTYRFSANKRLGVEM